MKNVLDLTKKDIERSAKNLLERKPVHRKVSWTVIVGDKELPAREVMFRAIGAEPNYEMNTYQTVNILNNLGFEVRYKGKPVKDGQFV